jgi:hypothetical protein
VICNKLLQVGVENFISFVLLSGAFFFIVSRRRLHCAPGFSDSKRAKKQISIAKARTKGEKMFPEAMFHRFSKGFLCRVERG